ncbi:MAG: VWA domain-containing protein [Labilithrix sp.]|nr:VWA domain-containing protein [Labilithrix sp.]MCW5814312.1 VWA domain-containing protein [Labilithrix sp.]
MRHAFITAFLGIGLVVVACGGDSGDNDDGASSGAQSSGTSGFNTSSSGASGDGGTTSSSGASGTSGGGCATTSKKAEKQPLDMVIGLDTSFSMDFDDKWINVRDALKSFVANPAYAELGVGLQFFPLRKQCSVPDYEALAVDLALQPVARGPLNEALSSQRMAGGTPMVPLLQGLSAYLAKNARPGRKPVIVLATDGFPDDTCLSSDDGAKPNTLENAVAIAGAAFEGTPPVATFVIGVGSELTSLNAIAAAGGTTKATLVDTSANAQALFLAALEDIRRTAIPCDFDIPAGDLNPKETNVTYTTPSGTRQMLYTANEAGCAKAPQGEGWYFDNEAAPKKVILCKAVCDVVKADDTGSVDLVFGCPRTDVK